VHLKTTAAKPSQGAGVCVVVAVNYRLGVLGNLYLPGVADGNYSVRDLEAALFWVKRNIQHFGGDPEAIVVAGQSAGRMVYPAPDRDEVYVGRHSRGNDL
jgi:carboxylesterase type B